MAATISFEIELVLSGIVEPGYRGDPTCPPYGESVEDMDITGVGVLELVPAPVNERGSHPRGVWKTNSLLDGVDLKNPEIQKLLNNIMCMKRIEIEEAIIEDASE